MGKPREGRGRRATAFLQRCATRRHDVVAVHGEPGLRQVGGHRRAHDAEADDADGIRNPPARLRRTTPLIRGATTGAHFFFFAFLAGALRAAGLLFARDETGAALTSTTATTHGSLPRTLHEWLVPRWMNTSPGLSSVSPLSRTAWISPLSTTM